MFLVHRFVLFKRHYDKYIALSAKYEEAKGIAYYLEERYHEVKVNETNRYREPSPNRIELESEPYGFLIDTRS